MEIDVRVMLKDEDGNAFMGIGVIWLLRAIEKHHSISQAAREMELSYPKALRMIRNLENGLHEPAVTRHHGGSLRGGAELTPKAKAFLERFEKLQSDLQQLATQRYEEQLESLFTGGSEDGAASARPAAGAGRRGGRRERRLPSAGR
jgi:molybdate transport system regulatory protein